MMVIKMSKHFVFMAMIFCHIVDDYYLQGILAKMKQEKWWKENAPSKLYKNDYIVALVMHGISWSFMTMFPIALYNAFNCDSNFAALLIMNAILHSCMDDAKANIGTINLVQDQLFHIAQIIFTFIILVALV